MHVIVGAASAGLAAKDVDCPGDDVGCVEGSGERRHLDFLPGAFHGVGGPQGVLDGGKGGERGEGGWDRAEEVRCTAFDHIE